MAEEQPRLKQRVDLPFPLKGIDEGWAYRRQPPGTTPVALNVRAAGQDEERIRGGKRSGMVKVWPDDLGGIVRGMGIATQAVTTEEGSEPATFTENFPGAGPLWSTLTSWDHYTDSFISDGDKCFVTPTADDADSPIIASNEVVAEFVGTIYEHHSIYPMSLNGWTLAGAATIELDVQVETPGAGDSTIFWIFYRVASSRNGEFRALGFYLNSTGSPPNTRKLFIILARGTTLLSEELGGTEEHLPDGVWFIDKQTIQVVIAADGSVAVSIAGTPVASWGAEAEYAEHTDVGFGVIASGDTTVVRVSNFVVTGYEKPIAGSSSRRIFEIMAVSGTNLYRGRTDETPAIVPGGAGTVAGTDPVAIQQAFGKMYIVNGLANTIANPGQGYRVYDIDSNFAEPWIATEGELPVNEDDEDNACHIIALYRGRIVLAGRTDQPQNWFMSAVGDPFNWDYFPAEITATMAVAGHVPDGAGQMGDIITALAPYADDMLIMGGVRSVAVMRGDPAAGGQIDTISNQIGVYGPEAWAFDPSGNFYFFGNGEVWRMTPPLGFPETVSGERLRRALGEIDAKTTRVLLAWDSVHDGLHLYACPAGESAPDESPGHYFWERSTDSWWKDTYPAEFGPFSALAFHGDDAAGRGVLLGGWDGHLRRLESSATTDDGEIIDSVVDLTPMVVAGDMATTHISEIVAVMSQDGDPVTLSGYADESAEAVVKAAFPRFSRLLAPGRNGSVLNRLNGNAFKLRLANATAGTWSMESISAVIAPGGRARYRRL